MGQMCTGGRKSMLMNKHGKLNTSGAHAKYSYMDTNDDTIHAVEQLSFSEYYTILAVDVTNLQSTGKFPTRRDFIESIDENDFERRDAIIELMVVSNSKELWTTFNEYIKNNKTTNLHINWPGIAHLAIYIQELGHFEYIFNSCEQWDINTIHELFESCVNSGGLGGLEIAKCILSKHKFDNNNSDKKKSSNTNYDYNNNQSININRRNGKGETYLYIACKHSLDEDFIKMLLQNGADPRLKSNEDKDALDIAKSILKVRNTFENDKANYVQILHDQKNYKLTGCGYNGYEEAADQIGISTTIIKLLEEEKARLANGKDNESIGKIESSKENVVTKKEDDDVKPTTEETTTKMEEEEKN